jgi:hypothetical protein
MANFYDDSKFGVIERTWFGLTPKWGGEESAGRTFNETQANINPKKWYARGPIEILKIGCLTLGTLGKGEQLFGLTVNGTATVKGVIQASTASAPGTIASNPLTPGGSYQGYVTGAAKPTLAAGSYLTLLASTNVCSTGTVALFIDWRRRFTVTGKWDS